jgi:hypothetical protein
MHIHIITALLERFGTMGKRPFVVLQVCISLLNLLHVLSMALSRVGNNLLGKESSSEERGELHNADGKYA